MAEPTEILIDHAAALQQQVDRLTVEMTILAAGLLALAVLQILMLIRGRNA